MEGYTEIFVWGLDNCGQLGLGTETTDKKYPTPVFCSFNIVIRELSCGEDHAGFISDLGHVYCMGNNLNGKLGIGDKHKLFSTSPVLVEALSQYTATKISCGWTHTAIITKEQKLFTWGCGEFGALGTGSIIDAWQPVEVLNNIQDVSCGARHTGAVSKGALYMCGAGEMGQLGTGKRMSENGFCLVGCEKVRQVACGVFHTGIVCLNGNVWMMGGNSYGQLGTGNKKSAISPVKVGVKDVLRLFCGSSSMCITSDGLYVWGSSVLGEFLSPRKVKVSNCPVIDAALGGSFIIVMDSKGNLHTWGTNQNGELGLGDFDSRAVPIQISSLKGKKIKKVLAGGSFVICLGQETHEKKDKNEPKYAAKTAREFRNTKFEEFRGFERTDEIPVRLGDDELWALRQENLQLKESLAWYRNQVENEKPKLLEESFQKLKESYVVEIKSLREQMEAQTGMQKDLEEDLQVAISHTYRLEHALSEAQGKVCSKEMNDFQNIKKDYKNLEDQNMDLKFSIESYKMQIKELEDNNENISQENSYLKQSLSDLQQESFKLTKYVSDLQSSIDSLNSLIQSQESRLHLLSSENSSLKSEIIHAHSKNDELIQNFEKDISTRARAFKDKTLSILSISKSRNLTPDDHTSKTSRRELSTNQREKIKNAVNRLIDCDSVSPVQTASPVKSPDRPFKPLNLEFQGKTPSRGDVQKKINDLIQNRSRIEQKMNRLNQEQDFDY